MRKKDGYREETLLSLVHKRMHLHKARGMGGDLGRDWGTVLSKIWGGGQPMYPSPQYLEKLCYRTRVKWQNE